MLPGHTAQELLRIRHLCLLPHPLFQQRIHEYPLLLRTEMEHHALRFRAVFHLPVSGIGTLLTVKHLGDGG